MTSSVSKETSKSDYYHFDIKNNNENLKKLKKLNKLNKHVFANSLYTIPSL